MSDIAKCPNCGCEPYLSTRGLGCCGVAVKAKNIGDAERQWNQYAAAMELAKAMVAMRTPNESGHKAEEWDVLSEAAKKAYEVFK